MITLHCIHSKDTALIYLKKRKQQTSTRLKKQQHYFEIMKVICSFKRHIHWFSNAIYVDFLRNIRVNISPIYIYFIILLKLLDWTWKLERWKKCCHLLYLYVFPSYLYLLLFVFNFCHILTDICKLLLHLHCIALQIAIRSQIKYSMTLPDIVSHLKQYISVNRKCSIE